MIVSCLFTSGRTALAACCEMNPIQNSSAVLSLPKWQCSLVPVIL